MNVVFCTIIVGQFCDMVNEIWNNCLYYPLRALGDFFILNCVVS